VPTYRVPQDKLDLLREALGVKDGRASVVPKRYVITTSGYHIIEVDKELPKLKDYKV